MDTLELGLIGYGTIGRAVGEAVVAGRVPGVSLGAVMTRRCPEALPAGVAWSPRLDDLLAAPPGLVVEAAGAEVLAAVATTVLGRGVSLMALSVSAFTDPTLYDAAHAAARAGGSRLICPSGAIAGLDAIAAATMDRIDRVVLTQRKPPAALLPPPEAAAVTAETVLAEGTAREIARRFPKNANIAAALALAGPGFEAVRVRVVADPAVSRNTVELEAEGAFGRLSLVQANVPTANARTSYLVILSTLAALTRHAGAVVCPA